MKDRIWFYWIKAFANKIENKLKEQKGGLLGMLMATLGATLLGNILTSKGVIWGGEKTIKAG